MAGIGLCLAAPPLGKKDDKKDEAVGPAAARKKDRVHPGMTPKQVREMLDEPTRISRQILHRRQLEQWYYDKPIPLWIEFNCVKGQEPYVLTVQGIGPAKP
jgi:hypothetical protein